MKEEFIVVPHYDFVRFLAKSCSLTFIPKLFPKDLLSCFEFDNSRNYNNYVTLPTLGGKTKSNLMTNSIARIGLLNCSL